MTKYLLQIVRIPFIRDVTTMQIGRLVIIASSFIASILYVRFLGLAGYGEYSVVLAYTGTVGLLTNLGQQATTLTFFAEAYGRKDYAAQTRVLHYYVLTSAGAALLLILLAFTSPMITKQIYGQTAVGTLASLVFASSICELPFIFISIVLQTTREIRTLTILENTKNLLQICIAVGLLMMGFGVPGLIASSLITAACFSLIGMMLYPGLRHRYGLPKFRSALRSGDLSHFWQYTKDGAWIAIDKSLGNLYPNIFLFTFSTQVSPAVVGLLRLGMKLADLPASFVLSSISRLASSAIPVMVGKGKNSLRSSLLRLTKHTAALHVGVSLLAALIIPPLLPLVYGPNFQPAVYPFLVILFLNMSLALHAIATPILRISSKIHIAAILNGIATLVGIGLFFGLETLMQPLWSLYIALTVYHCIIGLVFFPVMKTLGQMSQKDGLRLVH